MLAVNNSFVYTKVLKVTCGEVVGDGWVSGTVLGNRKAKITELN